MDTIVPQETKMELFGQLDDIIHDVGFGQSREVLGFRKRELVICDGQKIQPVTMAQSIKWLLRVKKAEKRGVYDSSEGTYEGHIKWLTSALAALPI